MKKVLSHFGRGMHPDLNKLLDVEHVDVDQALSPRAPASTLKS